MVYWLTLLVVSLVLIYALSYVGKKRYKLPPGPYNWPVVGSMFLMGRRNRHHTLAKLAKKYGPIMYMRVGSRPYVIVSNSEMAREVLKEHDSDFCSRPNYHTYVRYASSNFRNLIFSPYGERWKMLRRVSATELFTTGRVKSFAGIRHKELAAFAGLISSKNRIDLTVMLSELFTNMMTRVVFGRKFYNLDGTAVTPEAEAYRSISDKLGEESSKFYFGDNFPAFAWIDGLRGTANKLNREILPSIWRFMESVIEEHKKTYQVDVHRDFVDVMLSLKDNKLDNESIIGLLRDIVQGGTKTSQGTVEWAFSEVIRNPSIQKKAHEELDRVVGRERFIEETDLKNMPYVNAIVKEVMRMRPVVAINVPHYNEKDALLSGYSIPAGTNVLVNIWAIHHDPEVWKDPEEFIPERFLNGSERNILGQHFDLIPFSSGRRRCVGMPLAISNITFTLAYLLHRFEWLAPPGEEIDMEEKMSRLTLFPAKHRIVCASPRLNIS